MNKQNLVNKRFIVATIALGILLAFVLATTTLAGYKAQPLIPWQVLSGGGAPAAFESGSVSFNSSLGQAVIGPSSSGDLEINSGFWFGSSGKFIYLYLPISINH